MGEAQNQPFQLPFNPATFPGTAISLTVLSINLVGEGLRDALNPRSRPA